MAPLLLKYRMVSPPLIFFLYSSGSAGSSSVGFVGSSSSKVVRSTPRVCIRFMRGHGISVRQEEYNQQTSDPLHEVLLTSGVEHKLAMLTRNSVNRFRN